MRWVHMNYNARRYAKRKGLPSNIQIVSPTRHGVGLGKHLNRAKYLGRGTRWNIIDNQEKGKDNEQSK